MSSPTSSDLLRYIAVNSLHPTPHTLFSVSTAVNEYKRLSELIPADIWFAVKAAPLPELLTALAELGCGADVASPAEVELCLKTGIPAESISYGNPIRSQSEIVQTAAFGVRTWVVDTELEVQRLAEWAPGSRVILRLANGGIGADWPLSYRFGCAPSEARRLAREADKLDLEVIGLCWHVGSQQRNIHAWDAPLEKAAALWKDLAKDGIHLSLLNLGGGLPAFCYSSEVPPIEQFASAILAALDKHFPSRPQLAIEPGRALTAASGVTVVEVKAIADRPDGKRYVFLNGGLFSIGLIESVNDAVRYNIEAIDYPTGVPTSPVVITGPSCDSFDTLTPLYRLPAELKVGDRIAIWGTGSYTWPYAAQQFNGHVPAPVVAIL